MAGWQPPSELPDLRRVGLVALDTETSDEGLRAQRGSAWPWRGGYVCGVSVAWHGETGICANYIPIQHPGCGGNFERENVRRWLTDHIAAGVRFVTQNGLYDWGWLGADLGVAMPPAEQLEEIGALATLVDENRFSYGLDSLCTWRGLPGKDTTELVEAVKAAGFKVNKKNPLQSYIWRLPAALIGPYAEADAIATLALFEDLNPILDREGTRDAYRLDVDLMPMVHEMRRRGIRIDQDGAEQARDYCLQKRDRALAELSDELGTATGMDEIASPKWKARTFDAHGISYPRTPKGNPSFKAGKTGWMATHPHWLPQLITVANKYHDAGAKFLEGHILEHLIGGRVYAEINPFRSESGGTKSFRFSYAAPPLQQMPSRDEELGPLTRRVFVPEEGETWCTVDCSQQEFRLVVHEAAIRNLPGAQEAVERYRDDPDVDFHQLVSEITGLPRKDAKAVNFAKIYGAGVKKFAEMIGKPLGEAQAIYEQYDRMLPFVAALTTAAQREANRHGYTVLYDGARRHWDRWATRHYATGAGPCSREEAKRRIHDPGHPWYGGYLERAGIHTALNALIQGSAARHTKLWMRACWREGIIPHIQMHDGLELSVTRPEQGERVAQLACEAVKLEVPMRADQKYGRNWGDAQHAWQDLPDCERAAPITLATTEAPELEPALESSTAGAPERESDTPDEFPDEFPAELRDAPITVVSIPFIITGAMKERLYSCGFSQQDVREMTPQQAHDALGVTPMTAAPMAAASPLTAPAAPLEQPPPAAQANGPTPRTNGRPASGSGNGYDHRTGGSKFDAERDTYAEQHAGEPFNDAYLRGKGYRLVQVFDYTLADSALLYQQNRYELNPGIAPTKARPRKRFLPHHRVNGKEILGAPERRVIYNWPAVMRAGPNSFIFVCEGESNAKALNDAGLLATTVLSHTWTPECLAALTGCHLIILADHDRSGETLAHNAQRDLAPFAASARIVPATHLWEHLVPAAEPKEGDDVKDWLELGGDPKQLLDICRKIPAEGIITAKPYEFQAEADIAPWQWLYGRHLLRGEVSGSAAMGGTGKSTLGIVEALAMASGRALLGAAVPAPLRVVLVNLEDTKNTMDKRIAAAMRHYGLTPADIGDRLIVKAKGEIKIKVARQLRSGDVERNKLTIQALVRLMLEQYADVLSIDSFIRTHQVNENDNSAMQEVVECFEDVATQAQCAVHLWHHTRKGGGERATVEAARGAVAFIDACRSVRILETMAEKDHAQLVAIQPDMLPPGFYFRAFNGKRNFAPPADLSEWFKLENVRLQNRDEVGVATPWAYPETMDDMTPEIADRILADIDRGMPDGRRFSNHNAAKRRQAWPLVQKHCPMKTENQCRRIVAIWIKQGTLYEDEYDDPHERRRQRGLFVRKTIEQEEAED